MRLVIIESPYAGATQEEIASNVEYAKRAVKDCLQRNESPACSHLLFTQPGILRDEIPEERRQGIAAGLAWGRAAHGAVVYTDRGISPGMKMGIALHEAQGLPIEYRQIGA
jgi:hypothetical protein